MNQRFRLWASQVQRFGSWTKSVMSGKVSIADDGRSVRKQESISRAGRWIKLFYHFLSWQVMADVEVTDRLRPLLLEALGGRANITVAIKGMLEVAVLLNPCQAK